MIGVVVPAHDEEEHIGACVRSLLAASRCAGLDGEAVTAVVVADACSDATAEIATRAGAVVVRCAARNVGIARATGAQHALELGARWLAFTDADSVVAPDWISAQLALGSDAVCGTIAVADWGSYGERMKRHFEATYTDADGHRHIHGANLGVSAAAYLFAGGFAPLASSEDVAFVDALHRSGALIAWSAAPRVVTSARSRFRARGGFGQTLARIEREGSWAGSLPSE